MKKFLRKWLEVPEVKDGPDFFNRHRYVEISELKHAIESAIWEAFRPKDGDELRYWRGYTEADISGTLEAVIKKVSDERIRTGVDKRIDDLVNPEKFIDSVVERIKSKQIGG